MSRYRFPRHAAALDGPLVAAATRLTDIAGAASGVHGIDDLAAIDALDVDGRYAEVAVSELAPNHVHRHAVRGTSRPRRPGRAHVPGRNNATGTGEQTPLRLQTLGKSTRRGLPGQDRFRPPASPAPLARPGYTSLLLLHRNSAPASCATQPPWSSHDLGTAPRTRSQRSPAIALTTTSAGSLSRLVIVVASSINPRTDRRTWPQPWSDSPPSHRVSLPCS
jgi:hypothetical protein